MTRRIRLLLSSLLLLAVLVCVPAWLTWRAVRQERLDRALIVAVKKHDAAPAIAALKAGADANIIDSDVKPLSVWHYLLQTFDRITRREAQTNRKGIPVLLLALGDGTMPVTVDDFTIYPPDTRLITALLDAGADPNVTDRDGWTALLFAALYERPEIIRILLNRHADINAKNAGGQTAYQIAQLCGHQKIADLLKQAGAKE